MQEYKVNRGIKTQISKNWSEKGKDQHGLNAESLIQFGISLEDECAQTVKRQHPDYS